MVIRYESNDYIGYLAMEHLNLLTIYRRGNGYSIISNNEVLAHYSSKDLCDKAIKVLYDKYVDNPKQIVNVPTEDELKEDDLDDESIN